MLKKTSSEVFLFWYTDEMTNEQISKDFVAKIMAIQATVQNAFGSGIPGMMGMSGSAN